ncbi:hypothetical protein [Microvirga mediterraneensis]|uniref:Uncharacterized protein n=1 Tax=Microvirga mediterraneensis TaxID=2754695 RepID=A0A838BVY6_9HYPH|nr:hypothetical protein [Microvirga mediterraneensis]MBA1158676.1 hypothetical protein [Microvirga mediterraneensis]
MSFQAMLAARAHKDGRAQPSALFRHRAISENPLCIVAWQLGAEPYSVGAIAFGTKRSGPKVYVPGYPLDRELLFSALTDFAKDFCPAFEAYAQGAVEVIEHFGAELRVPKMLPQVIVANSETVGVLGRLGRRLAYLPTTGERAADPILPRLGRHFMWLAAHANTPGQQLILSMADLLATHYVAGMSSYEARSLAAMDAWVDPGKGRHGFDAAEVAERQAVGPAPDPIDAERVYDLMMQFNQARAGRRDAPTVRKLVKPLRDLYADLVDDTWKLVWKVVDRERKRTEAASVSRRVREDRIAYASHLSWMVGPAQGRRKVRMNSRSAAMRLNEYERAKAMMIAEEAIDDPLRMLPVLLAGKAIAGQVLRCDPDRRELINGRNCKRPSVVLRTDEPCALPTGTEVWWTKAPAGREWVIMSVAGNGAGSEVTLILQTNQAQEAGLPRVGQRACFSQLNTRTPYEVHLPQSTPWTHRPKEPPPPETDLENTSDITEAA